MYNSHMNCVYNKNMYNKGV